MKKCERCGKRPRLVMRPRIELKTCYLCLVAGFQKMRPAWHRKIDK